MNSYLSAKTAGYTIAAATMIVANTLLVFAKETNPALLATMKATLGHHWTTQGVVVIVAFLVLGFLLSKWPVLRGINGTFLAVVLFIATALAGAGLVGFFLFA